MIGGSLPAVELLLDEDALGLTALALKRLQDGEPSVRASHARIRDGIVVFGPTCMKEGGAKIVIERARLSRQSAFAPPAATATAAFACPWARRSR